MHHLVMLDKHVATAFAPLDMKINADGGSAIAFHDAIASEVYESRLAPTDTIFMHALNDLSVLSSVIKSTEQQWQTHLAPQFVDSSTTSPTRSRGRNRSHGLRKTATKKPKNAPVTKKRCSPTKADHTKIANKSDAKGEGRDSKSNSTRQRRKKDDDALDCIYDELQDSANMCRYWGKKCWNLRVAKPKGGFHSLCHFHRAKANDNQRRFDYKRRGTLWREFETDPDAEDVSLYPLPPAEVTFSNDLHSGGAFTLLLRNESAMKFEPFAHPVGLQDQDMELLQELVGCAER